MLTLQIDYALAGQESSFQKSCRECFISTLSNAITELEVQLGVKLFERNNKKSCHKSWSRDFDKASKIKLEVQNIHELAKNNSDTLNRRIRLFNHKEPLLFPVIDTKIPRSQVKNRRGSIKSTY